jgi:hypothetical protein
MGTFAVLFKKGISVRSKDVVPSVLTSWVVEVIPKLFNNRMSAGK